MRSKFGGKGDDEEDEEEMEKKELEDNERRAKHSIEGILGDRCEWAAPVIVADVEESGWHFTLRWGYLFHIRDLTHIRAQRSPGWSDTISVSPYGRFFSFSIQLLKCLFKLHFGKY